MKYKIVIPSKCRDGKNYIFDTVIGSEEICHVFMSDFKEDTPWKSDSIVDSPIKYYTDKEGYENHLVQKSHPSIHYAYNFNRAFKLAETLEDDEYLIVLEDDLEFTENWIDKLEKALVEIHRSYNKDDFLLTIYSGFEILNEKKYSKDLYFQIELDNYREFWGCQGTIWTKKRAMQFYEFNRAINLNNYNVLECNEITHSVDHLMAMFADMHHMDILTTLPSLIQHVGFNGSGLGPFMHQSHYYIK